MSKVLLFFVLIIFGVIIFLMAFKRVIVWPLFIPLIALVVIWYVVTFVVTEKMARKKYPSLSFFSRAKMLINSKTDMVHGALVITDGMLLFLKRKSEKGGLEVMWSMDIDQLESYTLEKVDDHHRGIRFDDRSENSHYFISNGIKKREKELKSALGIEDKAEGENS